MNELFEANLSIFRKRFPLEFRKIHKENMKSAFNWSDGPPKFNGVYLHSKYDPKKEAQKKIQNLNLGGTIMILGAGGGFYLEEFLKNDKIKKVLLLEAKEQYFISSLYGLNLNIIQDPKLEIHIGFNTEELSKFIKENYVPIKDGEFSFVNLNISKILYSDLLKDLQNEIVNTIESMKAEFSTQAEFGKIWIQNALANLKLINKACVFKIKNKSERAIVCGAGPTLKDNILKIAKECKDAILISTDTAYPILIENKIKVDLVVSIDPQIHSLKHFQRIDQDALHIFLLTSQKASAKRVMELGGRFTFIGSNHPIERILHKKLPLVSLNNIGINVGESGIRLASIFAKKIYGCGIDFCYPDGRIYSEGTYLENELFPLAFRLNPYMNIISLYYIADYKKEINEKYRNYTTTKMSDYKKALFKNTENGQIELKLEIEDKKFKINRQFVEKVNIMTNNLNIRSVLQELEKDIINAGLKNPEESVDDLILSLSYFYKKRYKDLCGIDIIDLAKRNLIFEIKKRLYEKFS